MGLDERLVYMLLGCAIGFVLGYFSSILHNIQEELQQIKEEVDDIDECVHARRCVPEIAAVIRLRNRNERGAAESGYLSRIALLLVVLVTVFAAFSSQRASNNVQDTQARVAAIASCNQQFLGQTVTALNERTSTTQDRAQANVDLAKAQASFLTVILERNPRASEARETAALQLYFDEVTDFLISSDDAKKAVIANPYPETTDLTDCVSQNMED